MRHGYGIKASVCGGDGERGGRLEFVEAWMGGDGKVDKVEVFSFCLVQGCKTCIFSFSYFEEGKSVF